MHSDNDLFTRLSLPVRTRPLRRERRPWGPPRRLGGFDGGGGCNIYTRESVWARVRACVRASLHVYGVCGCLILSPAFEGSAVPGSAERWQRQVGMRSMAAPRGLSPSCGGEIYAESICCSASTGCSLSPPGHQLSRRRLVNRMSGGGFRGVIYAAGLRLSNVCNRAWRRRNPKG